MCDPENLTGQERDEMRNAAIHAVPAPHQMRNPYTGEHTDMPTRAEAERDERECGR